MKVEDSHNIPLNPNPNTLPYLYVFHPIANCLKTIAEHQDHFQTRNTNDADTSSAGMGTFGVFAATTIVNSATSMFKDKFYAKQFGLSTAAAKIPKITYGLWGMRDCMVIGSSFILPDIMCGMLQEHSDLDKATALRVSQFACPIAAQFVSDHFVFERIMHYRILLLVS